MIMDLISDNSVKEKQSMNHKHKIGLSNKSG